MTMTEGARARAEESVSTRFTRLMNATTSRWGVLTDPSIVGVATAPPVVGLLAAVRFEAAPSLVLALEVLSAAPVSAAIICALVLTTSRRRVVDWLAKLPFPVENLNAVLNGLGDSLEVSFRGDVPDVPKLNVDLDKISVESFVTKTGPEDREPAAGELRWLEVRIGVVDSKRNPAGTNHERFECVRRIVEEVLVPWHEKHPIAEVRVK